MRYLGGKAGIAKWLISQAAPYRRDMPVWEPFCGGLNSAAAWGGEVLCSDASVPLIVLLRAVRDGWIPPHEVSHEEYKAARELPETDPMHGFCKFASWGGKPWGGYPRNRENEPYFRYASNALVRDIVKVTTIFQADFLRIEPHRTGTLIYCDPPYRGTTGYGFPFDHDLFELRCREWAKAGNTVLVSEQNFPGTPIAERERGARVCKIENGRRIPRQRIERLYRVDP